MVISCDSLVPRVGALENIGGRVYFLSVLRYAHVFFTVYSFSPYFRVLLAWESVFGHVCDTYSTNPGPVGSVSHRFRDLPGSWREA